jgi:hypothetical protein
MIYPPELLVICQKSAAYTIFQEAKEARSQKPGARSQKPGGELGV